MKTATELKHFCIYEYFLDGYFFKWEQMRESYLPLENEVREIIAKNGQTIRVKVERTEKISESEYKVLLISL